MLPNNMMKQAQQMVEKMQRDMARAQEELEKERVEAASGGGMVKAVANGLGDLLEIQIDPQVVDPSDVEMLQDLVVSAVREALHRAKEREAERMSSVAALPPGMNIPGLF
jgi:hypothetical protein